MFCLHTHKTDSNTKKPDALKVKVWKGKSAKEQQFTVVGAKNVELYLKYKARTFDMHCGFRRVFFQKRRNRAGMLMDWSQVAGKSWFGEYPKTLAKAVGAENAHLYTAHSVRRTGATAMANGGCSLLQLKMYGLWASDSVAQRYIDNSKLRRNEIATKALNGVGIESGSGKDAECDDEDAECDGDPGFVTPCLKRSRSNHGVHYIFENCSVYFK